MYSLTRTDCPRGEHIHHGYWPTEESYATESKEQAQINLIQLLLDISKLPRDCTVLDVGCGIGGTSRYLASKYGCTVTGITISTKQVEIANRLTKNEAEKIARSKGIAEPKQEASPDAQGFITLGEGKVRFIELDAEKMSEYFSGQESYFDGVWISEALSHFPNKPLFFMNTRRVLKQNGRLILADWFKDEGLDEQTFANDIKPIEGACSLL